ncbi:MAG: hypothetical protein HQL07_15995 [Nitrospirae bacterium]|nr:hypothetical protein [Magnetococcales bacterium]HAT49446.1 hypothetical protein [Alphaproteobacteria bacterium]
MSIVLEGEQQNLDESQSDRLQGEYQPTVAGEEGGDIDRTADSSGESKDDVGDVDYPTLSHDSPTRKPQRPASRSGRPERRILGIRLHESSMVYRLVASFPDLAPGDRLLLQTKDGEAEGCVIFVSNSVYTGKNDPRKLYPGSITRIIRKIGEHESSQADERREKEIQAKILGRNIIRQAALPMKLSRVIYQPGGTKAIFYFTSEVRVDFRDLVKQLSEELGVRVEMRHVGVRDETRLLGGVGHCGKDFCCSQYLQKFHPVSVRMAKNQDLSLNPDGISGVCGRLMCCLAYENDTYLHLRESLPTVKETRWTQDGREVLIRNVQPLRGRITCQFADGTRENCPAAALLPEKPAVASAMPTVSEDLEERIKEDVVVASQEVIDEVSAPAEGGDLGNEKKRSRKRRNRKKSFPVQGGSSGGMSNVVPSHQETAEPVVPAESGSRDHTQGSGEGGIPATSGKKRRRKKRKNSGNRGNSPPPEVHDNV